jgi:hypothetical protein
MTDAIIAGIATIVSSTLTVVITPFIKAKSKKDLKETLNEDIRDAIDGKWKGTFTQPFNGGEHTFNFEVTFKASPQRQITGKGVIMHDGEEYKVKMEGDYRDEGKFVSVKYENINLAITQFGYLIFKLADNPNKMSGHFLGNGHITGAILSGSITLKKV